MSGFYNVWPKVLHPNAELPQMESNGFQPPFFFGGSQVPTSLGLDNSVKGKGRGLTQPKLSKERQETQVDRLDKIYIPHTLPCLKK